MSKAIYEFMWDYGRHGVVEGMFIANKEDVEKAIGRDVYFGEILGKHSEVYGTLDDKDLNIKTENQEFISQFQELMGIDSTISGYNPLDYIE